MSLPQSVDELIILVTKVKNQEIIIHHLYTTLENMYGAFVANAQYNEDGDDETTTLKQAEKVLAAYEELVATIAHKNLVKTVAEMKQNLGSIEPTTPSLNFTDEEEEWMTSTMKENPTYTCEDVILLILEKRANT